LPAGSITVTTRIRALIGIDPAKAKRESLAAIDPAKGNRTHVAEALEIPSWTSLR